MSVSVDLWLVPADKRLKFLVSKIAQSIPNIWNLQPTYAVLNSYFQHRCWTFFGGIQWILFLGELLCPLERELSKSVALDFQSNKFWSMLHMNHVIYHVTRKVRSFVRNIRLGLKSRLNTIWAVTNSQFEIRPKFKIRIFLRSFRFEPLWLDWKSKLVPLLTPFPVFWWLIS